jgi:hypothetical protein
MVYSLRRWAQAAVAVLAVAALVTVVTLAALQHHPQTSSLAAVDKAMQASEDAFALPTLPPAATLPPPAPLAPAAPLAPLSTEASLEDEQPEPTDNKQPTMLVIDYLIPFMLPLLCLAIQVCCYFRSKHEPADIEEGLAADPQVVNEDLWGPHLLLTQVVKIIECFGCEARNRYVSGDGNFYIDEKSDCPQRCCASVNRELTLFGHAGPSEEAPVTLRMFKPYHLQGCCCCRPSLHIDVPVGEDKTVDVGRIEDPFKCCRANQMIFDANNDLRYEVTGSFCQCGACCPCCADFNFDINDDRGETVGNITKPRLNCKELCLKTNRFEIDFPTQCTMDDKRLLVGSAMLLDLQYFEQNKNQN